jgi:hypothetical protein
MFAKLLLAFALAGVTVVLHAVGTVHVVTCRGNMAAERRFCKWAATGVGPHLPGEFASDSAFGRNGRLGSSVRGRRRGKNQLLLSGYGR